MITWSLCFTPLCFEPAQPNPIPCHSLHFLCVNPLGTSELLKDIVGQLRMLAFPCSLLPCTSVPMSYPQLRVGRKLVIHIQTDILHKVLGSKSSKLLLLWTLALQEGHFLLPSGTHGHKEPPPRTYQPLQNLVLNP